MDINKDIFKAYDIRGIYPDEFDEEAAYRIAGAFARWLGERQTGRGKEPPGLRIVLGRDMRSSSPVLARAVMRGLFENGAEVLDTGLCTTPMHYFAINRLEADGGVMVTASHNPAAYNGLKLSGRGAVPFGLESGLGEIRDRALSDAASTARRQGRTVPAPILDAYADFVTRGIAIRNPSAVVIDAGGGMAGFVLPKICAKLRIPYVPLYFELDGSFSHHEANPSKEETLIDLKRAIERQSAPLGVAFDGDADRVGFVTRSGEVIRGDLITALLSHYFLKTNPGAKIIYEVRSSRIVRETVSRDGGVPVLSKAGHANMGRKMREEDAIFGGELSGHYFFKSFFYRDNAVLAFLQVLGIMNKTGVKLSELIQPFKKYVQSGELNFKVENSQLVFQCIRERFQDGRLLEFDGITVEYPDWWFNMRKSNTEPVMRLNVEADDERILKEKIDKVKGCLR